MAKPIVDMFSWNAPGNTLQDLYNWYLEGGDDDAGGGGTGTGGITNAYVGGDGGTNLQYNEMPTISPTAFGADPNAMQLGYQPVDNQYYLDDIGEGTIARDDLTLAESIVGDRGLHTMRKRDDDEEVPPGMEWLTKQYDKLPGYVKQYALPTTIGMSNPILGGAMAINQFFRPDATESAVGIGGLYAGEANLLGDLQQAGMLVDAGNKGIKTITGKNVVSLMGGYEEGQQEIYDKFISDYGSEDEVEQYLKDYAEKHNMSNWKKSFKYAQWKESKFNKDRTDIMTANTIANMKKQISDPTYTARHPSDIAKDAPVITPKTVSETAASEDINIAPAAPVYTGGITSPAHPSRDPDPGVGQQTSRDRADWGYDPFAQGGRVGYGNGGIVDLL